MPLEPHGLLTTFLDPTHPASERATEVSQSAVWMVILLLISSIVRAVGRSYMLRRRLPPKSPPPVYQILVLLSYISRTYLPHPMRAKRTFN